VFVTFSNLLPSLIFGSKSKSGVSTRMNCSLVGKYRTRVKVYESWKHPSLPRYGINNDCKKFYGIGSRFFIAAITSYSMLQIYVVDIRRKNSQINYFISLILFYSLTPSYFLIYISLCLPPFLFPSLSHTHTLLPHSLTITHTLSLPPSCTMNSQTHTRICFSL
jgi:hypothetical protein